MDELQASPEFVELWSRQDVEVETHGVQAFDHPQAGRFLLSYDAMALGDGQTLLAYTACDESDRAALEALRSPQRATAAPRDARSLPDHVVLAGDAAWGRAATP